MRLWIGIGLTFVIFAAAPVGALARNNSVDTAVVFLGSFYTDRYTEEHEYRDQLDLWRQGERIFGVSSSTAGLIGDQVPLLRRFDGTINARGVLDLSNGFRGTLKDSLLSGMDEDSLEMKLSLTTDAMGTNASRATTQSFSAWRQWADSLIDAAEASEPYFSQQMAECQAGDGWACLGLGNRVKERKPEDAKRYWRLACDRDAWPACGFLGEHVRADSILRRLCSPEQKPSLHRNMACEALGKRAEAAGRVQEAVKWYRLGCNEYWLPLTSCQRLKALEQSPSK